MVILNWDFLPVSFYLVLCGECGIKANIETQITLNTHRHFSNTLGFCETVEAAVRIVLYLSWKKDTWQETPLGKSERGKDN